MRQKISVEYVRYFIEFTFFFLDEKEPKNQAKNILPLHVACPRPYFWHTTPPKQERFDFKQNFVSLQPCDGLQETEERGSQMP